MKIKVYVANLAKHVEEGDEGRELQLPMEPELLKTTMNEVVGEGREGIIPKYTAPFIIQQFANIYELNEKLMRLAECGVDDSLLSLIFEMHPDLSDVLELVKDGVYTTNIKKINIRVANLEDYLAGKSEGCWLDIPMSPMKLKEKLDMLIGDKQRSIIIEHDARFKINPGSDINGLNIDLIRSAEITRSFKNMRGKNS